MCLRRTKQLFRKMILVVEIDGTVDVAAIKLILKPAINYNCFVKPIFVIALEHRYQCLLADPRKTVWFVIWDEIWKAELMALINIHDCVKGTLRLLCLHYVRGMLEHTQRSSELFPGTLSG